MRSNTQQLRFVSLGRHLMVAHGTFQDRAHHARHVIEG